MAKTHHKQKRRDPGRILCFDSEMKLQGHMQIDCHLLFDQIVKSASRKPYFVKLRETLYVIKPLDKQGRREARKSRKIQALPAADIAKSIEENNGN